MARDMDRFCQIFKTESVIKKKSVKIRFYIVRDF